MFRKTARASLLGSVSFDRSGDFFDFRRREAGGPESYYADGARVLNIREILGEVAEKYALSDDPSKYLFESIRANTTNVPNENEDGFHQSELLRFDTRVGMPVYWTYRKKPHHVDHITSNALAARGVILDSHYFEKTSAKPHCPTCNLHTAERENRDASNVHCRRCGTVVKDEFVEILLGIDASKDEDFAEGVRNGSLSTGSMGCECLNTRCNVCNHVAYSKNEFCEHIRRKGSLWRKARGVWQAIQPFEVEREAKRRGLNWAPTDFCYLTH
jgi:hypothetical protein